MSEALFQIRRGVQGDAAALAEFAARSYAETFGDATTPADLAMHLASAYGLHQQTEELTNIDLVTLLAECANRLAGYAQVRFHMPPDCVTDEGAVELWRFYVDKPWHGRGLARLLMEAVQAAARDLRGHILWLGVWERNWRAIRFYEKCGFRDVGTHSFWVGTDEQTDRIMVAQVAASESVEKPRTRDGIT
jgi:ribosomal protein S18 acetylase RimI-like enzyme